MNFNLVSSLLLLAIISLVQAYPVKTFTNSFDGVEYPFPLADIILTEEQQRFFLPQNGQKSGIDFGKDPTKKWTNNIIVYDFESTYSPSEIATIQAGQNMISSGTCLQFRRRTVEPDYVNIVRGSGCNSYLGKIGGKQQMSLASGCIQPGIVAHEFMHAAGVIHQHQRADRDENIIVNWDNIPPSWRQWFEKWTTTTYITHGVNYRVDSIMHYGSNTPGYWTNVMTSLIGHQNEMGQRSYLTEEDLLILNRMYQCTQ